MSGWRDTAHGESNARLLGLAVAANLTHAHQRRAGRAADFLQPEVRTVTVVAKRHPGAGGLERALADSDASVRAGQQFAAAAAAQCTGAVGRELRILSHPPRRAER